MFTALFDQLGIVNGFPGAPDGLTLGPRNEIYAAIVSQNRVARIDRNGVAEVVADADEGLDAPASLVFGKLRDRRTLYVTNLSIVPNPDAQPGLVKIKMPGRR